MKPDATQHDPRPEYLRALIVQSGLSIRGAAREIGIPYSSLRYCLTTPGTAKRWTTASYPVQYALERLAR